MLDGIGVLVTRPRQQSAELVAAIEQRGGNAIVFPSLEIVARDAALIEADLASLHAAQFTVFISRNAVEYGIDYADGRLAAIGPSTAAAIERAGRRVDIQSRDGFDSEHLLAVAALRDVSGKTVRIVRGGPGRERLADALRARGAHVDYLSVYERRMPTYSNDAISGLEMRWRAGEVNVVVVMSVQSLVNLQSLLTDPCLSMLAKTPLVTPSARVLKECLKRFPGCRAILAAGPQPETIADSIVECLAVIERFPAEGHTDTGLS